MRKQSKPSGAALREAVRRWGKHAAVRFDPRADEKERRDEVGAALRSHNAARPATKWVDGKMTPEYRAWKVEADRLLGAWSRHRCTVGVVVMGMFFVVRGQGDTWAEAFEDYDRKEAAEQERFRRLRAERGA